MIYTVRIPVEVHGYEDELEVKLHADNRHHAIECLSIALARLIEATLQEEPCSHST